MKLRIIQKIYPDGLVIGYFIQQKIFLFWHTLSFNEVNILLGESDANNNPAYFRDIYEARLKILQIKNYAQTLDRKRKINSSIITHIFEQVSI